VLEVDHIEPVSKGGSDEYANLITSCFDCNRGKSNHQLEVSDCDNVALMQVEQIAQLTALNQMLKKSVATQKEQCGDVVQHLLEVWSWSEDLVTEKDRASIRRFMTDLNFSQITRAIDIAAKKNSPTTQWKYFCGVCWSMIREGGDHE
jgi:hypothetical protein